jgi:hypothetical protein
MTGNGTTGTDTTGAGTTGTGSTAPDAARSFTAPGTPGVAATASSDGDDKSSATVPVGTSVSGGFTAARPLELAQSVSASFIYPIPESTFSHSNPNAVIALEARLSDGSALPAWMSFDPVRKIITGTPPQGISNEYEVTIIARDQFGGEAKTVLRINVGEKR